MPSTEMSVSASERHVVPNRWWIALPFHPTQLNCLSPPHSRRAKTCASLSFLLSTSMFSAPPTLLGGGSCLYSIVSSPNFCLPFVVRLC